MGEIRLADRRGLLGGDLSPVQHRALQILMIWDEVREFKRFQAERFDQVRTALIPLDPLNLNRDWIMTLWPDLYPKETADEVLEEDLVDTAGVWEFDRSMTSEEEITEVLRHLGSVSRVAMSVVDDNDGWV